MLIDVYLHTLGHVVVVYQEAPREAHQHSVDQGVKVFARGGGNVLITSSNLWTVYLLKARG